MKITILTIGKIKETYFTDAINEYTKRLLRYCTLKMIEFPDEKTKEGASDREINIIKDKEGEKVSKFLDENSGYVIALAIDGRRFSSESFAQKISTLTVSGNSHLIFLIGGSLGISDELLKRADLKISFSDMTFPHQLMRVILLEQIYRAFRIINKEPYHK